MKVFTNGCFDILHAGHVDLLSRARQLGDHLTVGINSDASVRSIKGEGRPVNSADARRAVLLGLESVDEVIIFDELTPETLIRQLRPDVLVKGGDWQRGEIIGADLVESYGGSVHSLPLVDGFSTSDIINKMNGSDHRSLQQAQCNALEEHIQVLQRVISTCSDQIQACSDLIWETFRKGNKLLICGNGGSAADAQHLAAEFVGRYEVEREALPAIALTTDTSAITALANDYDFDAIFARQVDALATKGDCLIAISTSGNSPNVIAAVMTARSKGCSVIAMTGDGGKKLASLSDACLMVPSSRTSRIQEAHITVAHVWCEFIEAKLKDEGGIQKNAPA